MSLFCTSAFFFVINQVYLCEGRLAYPSLWLTYMFVKHLMHHHKWSFVKEFPEHVGRQNMFWPQSVSYSDAEKFKFASLNIYLNFDWSLIYLLRFWNDLQRITFICFQHQPRKVYLINSNIFYSIFTLRLAKSIPWLWLSIFHEGTHFTHLITKYFVNKQKWLIQIK